MLLAVGLEITEELDNQREAAGPPVFEGKMWRRGGQEGEENWGDAGGGGGASQGELGIYYLMLKGSED